MTHIHLIGGEKGGVGKSLVAPLVAQYFIDHSIPFLGFDSDRSHGALLRFYAGYASPAVARLGLLERQRLRTWLKSAYDGITRVNP
jgi:cellulose biosynthesis protein BcsQ